MEGREEEERREEKRRRGEEEGRGEGEGRVADLFVRLVRLGVVGIMNVEHVVPTHFLAHSVRT